MPSPRAGSSTSPVIWRPADAPHGIRVNCLSPGGYYGGQPEVFVRNYEVHTPRGRMARWNDLKGAAVCLASDASQYITGQNLAVDGG